MRDSEVTHLRRSCLHVTRDGDGRPYRWKLASLAFKGERDPAGVPATWVVGEPVARAIEILQEARPAHRPPQPDHQVPQQLPGDIMTANTMPGNHDVHAMLAQMRAEAGDGGPEPSVLALARRLEMANTTFRRNYPAVVAELTRPAAARHLPETAVSRYQELQQAATQLRSDNRQLRHDLDTAAAVIQRLALENHQLRQQLEDTANVTRIVPAPRRG